MGKRLLRITSVADAVLKTGSEIQVITQTGITYPGTLVKVEQKKIYLKDSGGKIHCIGESDIREVIIDQVAPY